MEQKVNDFYFFSLLVNVLGLVEVAKLQNWADPSDERVCFGVQILHFLISGHVDPKGKLNFQFRRQVI
jgi:hypothetical protein|tara:strand:+ start:312 stop:515 length:204 start_codon:yes stop_codon:yes gene_type:complete